jgi:hypothetical protein
MGIDVELLICCFPAKNSAITGCVNDLRDGVFSFLGSHQIIMESDAQPWLISGPREMKTDHHGGCTVIAVKSSSLSKK